MPKIPVSSVIVLIAILFFCASLAVSIASFPPGFSPLDNWMSDLGNPELNPAGSAYFNLACMVTGLFLAVFYLGLSGLRSTGMGKPRMLSAAQVCGIFSGIALAGVGYFPETFSPHHFIVSVLFFLSSTVAILLATEALRGYPGIGRAVAGAGYLTVVIGIVFSAQMIMFESVTIIEWISVLSMLAWAALTGWGMSGARGQQA
ncbi:MAG TPA: DUF998 domain-containing protein [Methanocella sp.]